MMKIKFSFILFVLLTLVGCGGNSRNSGGYDDEAYEEDPYCAMCFGTGKFQHPSTPFVNPCSFCNGTGVSSDSRYNTTSPRYTCLYCNGSGRNQFTGGACTFCYGYGVTYTSPQEQVPSGGGYDNGYDNGGNNSGGSSSQSICPACGGRTTCPVCRVTGGVKYGDIRYCSSCGNTGKCKWCGGRGIIVHNH